jgi:hypothetical protein
MRRARLSVRPSPVRGSLTEPHARVGGRRRIGASSCGTRSTTATPVGGDDDGLTGFGDFEVFGQPSLQLGDLNAHRPTGTDSAGSPCHGSSMTNVGPSHRAGPVLDRCPASSSEWWRQSMRHGVILPPACVVPSREARRPRAPAIEEWTRMYRAPRFVASRSACACAITAVPPVCRAEAAAAYSSRPRQNRPRR